MGEASSIEIPSITTFGALILKPGLPLSASTVDSGPFTERMSNVFETETAMQTDRCVVGRIADDGNHLAVSAARAVVYQSLHQQNQ